MKNTQHDNKYCLPHISVIQNILLMDGVEGNQEMIKNQLDKVGILLQGSCDARLVENFAASIDCLNTDEIDFLFYFNNLTFGILCDSLHEKRGYEYYSKHLHEDLDAEQKLYFEICDKYDELSSQWYEKNLKKLQK